MLTLYFAPGSSSMAPHVALHEIGVPFESRVVSFACKETRSPEFLAINPRGKVPVLDVGGHLLTEVAGILFYLARRHPEAGLLPAGDPLLEGDVVSWMSFLASGVHPAAAQGPEHSTPMFALAEQRLGSSAWAVGDAYSIADIHLFRLFWRFKNRLNAAPQDFPNLTAHHDRIMQRPAVQKTIAVEAALGYELPGFTRPPTSQPA
jgi:glutathione S-transferase